MKLPQLCIDATEHSIHSSVSSSRSLTPSASVCDVASYKAMKRSMSSQSNNTTVLDVNIQIVWEIFIIQYAFRCQITRLYHRLLHRRHLRTTTTITMIFHRHHHLHRWMMDVVAATQEHHLPTGIYRMKISLAIGCNRCIKKRTITFWLRIGWWASLRLIAHSHTHSTTRRKCHCPLLLGLDRTSVRRLTWYKCFAHHLITPGLHLVQKTNIQWWLILDNGKLLVKLELFHSTSHELKSFHPGLPIKKYPVTLHQVYHQWVYLTADKAPQIHHMLEVELQTVFGMIIVRIPYQPQLLIQWYKIYYTKQG